MASEEKKLSEVMTLTREKEAIQYCRMIRKASEMQITHKASNGRCFAQRQFARNNFTTFQMTKLILSLLTQLHSLSQTLLLSFSITYILLLCSIWRDGRNN